MNKTIVLDERELFPESPEVNREAFLNRRAARAVLTDSEGKVGLLYVGNHNYYKLPGGGIDEGEEIKEALARELLEELGCQAAVTGELCTVIEYRDYWQMIQTSYCYRAVLIGDKGMPSFTEEELQDGFQATWADNIEHAIRLVETTEPIDKDEKGIRFMRERELAILRLAQIQS